MTALSHRPDLKWWDLDGEAVVYDPTTGTGHVLNATAREIWRLCNGRNTSEDIVEVLVEAFPDQEPAISHDVPTALHQLIELNLAVENAQAA